MGLRHRYPGGAQAVQGQHVRVLLSRPVPRVGALAQRDVALVSYAGVMVKNPFRRTRTIRRPQPRDYRGGTSSHAYQNDWAVWLLICQQNEVSQNSAEVEVDKNWTPPQDSGRQFDPDSFGSDPDASSSSGGYSSYDGGSYSSGSSYDGGSSSYGSYGGGSSGGSYDSGSSGGSYGGGSSGGSYDSGSSSSGGGGSSSD